VRRRRHALCAALAATLVAGCATIEQYVRVPSGLLGDPGTAKRTARIAVLPFAYRDGNGARQCDICPDTLVMDVTSQDDALLMTAFLYEALTRHPRLQIVPYETVQAAQGDSMRATLDHLARTENLDAVVVGALLELRDRFGDPRSPDQRAGAAVYAALLDLPSGRPVWKRLYDHTPGRPTRAVREYERIVIGEESKALTAHEVAQAGIDRMASSLARAVR
jgi:hypothetical protein